MKQLKIVFLFLTSLSILACSDGGGSSDPVFITTEEPDIVYQGGIIEIINDNRVFIEGENLTGSVSAIGTEGRNLTDITFTWVSDIQGELSSNADIDTALDPGYHDITVTADNQGNKSSKNFQILVLPSVHDIELEIDQGESLLITSSANLGLTANVIARPIYESHIFKGRDEITVAWESDVDGPLGEGFVLLTEASIGTHVITMSASDSIGGTAIDIITVEVVEAQGVEDSSNLFISAANLSFNADITTHKFQISNPGPTELDWSFTNSQSWLRVSPPSGTLANGSQEITINVDASELGRGQYTDIINLNSTTKPSDLSIAITLEIENHAPRIVNNPLNSVSAGSDYVYVIDVEDKDNDQLVFTLNSGPEGMTLDPDTGELNWQPEENGRYPVSITIEDGQGESIPLIYELNVEYQSPNEILVSGPRNACVYGLNNLACWGANESNQLTINTDIGAFSPEKVAIGENHICVIANGSVSCQGNDEYDKATPINFLNNPTDIALGRDHSCVITEGQIRCWGNESSPVITDQPTDITTATSIASGDEHACALYDVGVTCWGANDAGQTTVPSEVNSPENIYAIANQTCITQQQELVCWGGNESNELNVQAIPFLNLKRVAMGPTHTCVTHEDTISCSGNQTGGRANPPVGLPSSTQILASSTYSCILESGNVSCWGSIPSDEAFYVKNSEVHFDYIEAINGSTIVIDNGQLVTPQLTAITSSDITLANSASILDLQNSALTNIDNTRWNLENSASFGINGEVVATDLHLGDCCEQISFSVSGDGSRLNLNSVSTITLGVGQSKPTIEASNDGAILLNGVESITQTGADQRSVASFTTRRGRIEFANLQETQSDNGGRIVFDLSQDYTWDQLTTLNNTSLSVKPDQRIDMPNLRQMFGSRIEIAERGTFQTGLTRILGCHVIINGNTASFQTSVLEDIDNTRWTLTNGAQFGGSSIISDPEVILADCCIFEENDAGLHIRVSGNNSRLDLSNVRFLILGTSQSEPSIEALNGGAVLLNDVESIRQAGVDQRSVATFTSQSGRIEFANLQETQSDTGGRTVFDFSQDYSWDRLTTLNNTTLSVKSDQRIEMPNLGQMFESRLEISERGTFQTGLTRILGSHVIINGTSASFQTNVLEDIDNTRWTLANGAQFGGNGIINDPELILADCCIYEPGDSGIHTRVSGTGSILDFSNVRFLILGTALSELSIEASNGGAILFNNVESIRQAGVDHRSFATFKTQNGRIEFSSLVDTQSDTGGRTVFDFSQNYNWNQLTTLNNTWISVKSDQLIEMPNLRQIFESRLEIAERGSFQTSLTRILGSHILINGDSASLQTDVLEDIDNTRWTLGNGAKFGGNGIINDLELILEDCCIFEESDTDMHTRVSGENTILDFNNVRYLTVGINLTDTFIEATNSGTILFNDVEIITQNGQDSRSESSFSATSNGTIEFNSLSELLTPNNGTLNFNIPGFVAP